MLQTALAALVLALPALATSYAIKADGVNCRTGPGTSYSVSRTYSTSDSVTLTCQTTGTTVSGDSLWDKTTDGCYVADYYVKTGTSGYVASVCGTSTGVGCSTLNAATIALIKSSEGFVASVYSDAVGLPTIGYGHQCTDSTCSDVTGAGYSLPLTTTTASALLASDVKTYTTCLSGYLDASVVTLNDNQWGALISWTYNVGCSNVKSSTLVSELNAGQDADTVAAAQLPLWNKAGGVVLAGLVTRRAAEVTLFETASSSEAFPTCA